MRGFVTYFLTEEETSVGRILAGIITHDQRGTIFCWRRRKQAASVTQHQRIVDAPPAPADSIL